MDSNNNKNIRTGIMDFDKLLTCGFNTGELMVIAGRPSMGATSFAMSIMRNITIETRSPVLWLSFNMTHDEFMKRFIVSLSGVPYSKYHRFHLLTSQECNKLKEASEIIAHAPVYFDVPYDLENIKSIIQNRLKDQFNEKDNLLVIIDDIHSAMSTQKRHQISPFIRKVATDFNLPVVVTTSLNRRPENRSDKIPRLGDLLIKNLEKDADKISLILRESVYTSDSHNKDSAHIHVLKNLGGSTGSIKLTFDPNTGVFE